MSNFLPRGAEWYLLSATMGGGEDHDAPANTEEHTTPSVADREETDEAGKEEEDTGAQIAPIVKLEEVAVSTGEEDEVALIDL